MSPCLIFSSADWSAGLVEFRETGSDLRESWHARTSNPVYLNAATKAVYPCRTRWSCQSLYWRDELETFRRRGSKSSCSTWVLVDLQQCDRKFSKMMQSIGQPFQKSFACLKKCLFLIHAAATLHAVLHKCFTLLLRKKGKQVLFIANIILKMFSSIKQRICSKIFGFKAKKAKTFKRWMY